ncbi:TraM recognition domain-containing protein [Lactiplantibacillus plantarum]|uniref:TraM recognition domain-containing protein n=1 Tax=Lactiplantibacillus plantarum TaxID=1590 RepID=UPI001BA7D4C7|nr:TraM recognition domain-containing protein [Lactiplantibacillus plantarum]MBS0954972.1 type IV secretory system conjugative DNA transfer family protein [Lactiplantibacillus plantarum]
MFNRFLSYFQAKVETEKLTDTSVSKEHSIKMPKWLNSYVASVLDKANQSTIKEVLAYLKVIQKAVWLVIGIGYLVTVLIPALFPFSSPNLWFLPMWIIGLAICFATFTLNRLILDINTRVQGQTHVELEDKTFKVLRDMRLQSTIALIWVISLPVAWYIIPFFNNLLLNPNPIFGNTQSLVSVAGNQVIFHLVWLGLMIMVGYRQLNFDLYEEQRYRVQIKQWVDLYRFHYAPLHNLLEGSFPEHYPVITIGESIITQDRVDLLPMDTLTNYMIVGSIGQGKTSTAFEPAIKQYLDYIAMYIRAYPELIKNPKFATRGVAPTYCNGLVVIETTNSLNSDVEAMALKLGIPKSLITILNPEDAHTDSFNVMRGPVAKAAEVVVSVVQGLSFDSQDFFQIKEKTNLRSYVYLAKLASVVEDRQPDFNDVYQMYLQPQLIHDRQQHLKVYIALLRLKFNQVKKIHDDITKSLHINSEDLKRLEDEYSSKRDYARTAYFKTEQNARQQMISKVVSELINDDTDNLQDTINKMSKIRFEYLELRDKLTIAQQTDLWFDTNIEEEDVTLTIEGVKVTTVKYHDKNESFVGGLTAQLDTLAQSPGIRRVLFRESGTFNLDDHFRNGGILLMNTGKGALGSLSQTLGSIFVSVVENATFRRMPNVEPIHPVYMDEVVDYMPETFQDFPSQSRKYNVPLIVAFQSLAQINNKFNQDFTNVLLNVFRIKAVFGDVDPIEANTLSAMFGTKTIFTEDHDEHDVNEVNAAGKAVSKTRQKAVDVPNLSPDELVNMEPYTMAIRHPVNNEAQQFDQVKVNRITDDTLSHDINRIDLTTDSDYKAYQSLINNAGSLNPDFDQIDVDIRKHLEQGDYNEVNAYQECLQKDRKIDTNVYGLLPAYDVDTINSQHPSQGGNSGTVKSGRYSSGESSLHDTSEDEDIAGGEIKSAKLGTSSYNPKKTTVNPNTQGTQVKDLTDNSNASTSSVATERANHSATDAKTFSQTKKPAISEDESLTQSTSVSSTPTVSRSKAPISQSTAVRDISSSASSNVLSEAEKPLSSEDESLTKPTYVTHTYPISRPKVPISHSAAVRDISSSASSNVLSEAEKPTSLGSEPLTSQQSISDSNDSKHPYNFKELRAIAKDALKTAPEIRHVENNDTTSTSILSNDEIEFIQKYVIETDETTQSNSTITKKINSLKTLLLVLKSKFDSPYMTNPVVHKNLEQYILSSIHTLDHHQPEKQKPTIAKTINAASSDKDFIDGFKGLTTDPLKDGTSDSDSDAFNHQNGM